MEKTKPMHRRLIGIIFAIALLLLAQQASAVTYSENFDSLNHSTITTFNTTNNGLSATYEGGTAFTAGVGVLYRSGTKSWMVDVVGIGGSTGQGTVTFSVGAKSIKLYFRNQSNQTTSTLQVRDEFGAAIQDFTGITTDWREVAVLRNDGDPLIKTIVLNNSGSVGMVAVDDLNYSPDQDITGMQTSNSGSGSGGGGGSLGLWLIGLLISIFLAANKYRQFMKTT